MKRNDADLIGGIDNGIHLKIPGIPAPKINFEINLIVHGKPRENSGAALSTGSSSKRIGEVSERRWRRIRRRRNGLFHVDPPRYLIERDVHIISALRLLISTWRFCQHRSVHLDWIANPTTPNLCGRKEDKGARLTSFSIKTTFSFYGEKKNEIDIFFRS